MISGSWCYSDQQAEWAFDLGEQLKGFNPDDWPDWLDYVSVSGLAMGTVLIGFGEIGIPASIIALASNPIGWVVGFAIVDAYLLWNYPDIALPANLKVIPFWGQILSLYSLQSIIRGEGEPLTPERLEQSFLGGASLLMSLTSLTENEYQELYTALVSGSKQDTDNFVEKQQLNHLDKVNEFLDSGGPKGDKGKFLKNLYDVSKKKCDDGWNELKSGDIIHGTVDITIGLGGFNIWGSLLAYEIIPKEVWPKILQKIPQL